MEKPLLLFAESKEQLIDFPRAEVSPFTGSLFGISYVMMLGLKMEWMGGGYGILCTLIDAAFKGRGVLGLCWFIFVLSSIAGIVKRVFSSRANIHGSQFDDGRAAKFNENTGELRKRLGESVPKKKRQFF